MNGLSLRKNNYDRFSMNTIETAVLVFYCMNEKSTTPQIGWLLKITYTTKSKKKDVPK